MRALLVGILCLLAAPSAAQAYYVDISITGAGRVYESTDANELDEHCPAYAMEGFASPSTTPTGTLGATCQAGSADGDYGWNWVVRYVAEASPGYRFAGWQSDGRTNPGPVICDGANGSPSYSGTACQFATTANLQIRARFVDDTPPVMATLTGPNQVVNGPATFTFSAFSDPTLSHFQCRVAGVHEWQTCSSGRQENPGTGTYTFQVRAVDWSGNVSAESTWEWTVDKVAPETTLAVSGPMGTVSSTTASFEFPRTSPGRSSARWTAPPWAAARRRRTAASRRGPTRSQSGRATWPATRTPRRPAVPGPSTRCRPRPASLPPVRRARPRRRARSSRSRAKPG